MKLKAVLFDLDGTLLPLEQDVFTRTYFELMTKKLMPYGYPPDKLIEAVWDMASNDGTMTTEERFWKKFCELFGKDSLKDKYVFEDFYQNEFYEIKKVCGYNELVRDAVMLAKSLGLKVAVATNPLFPAVATNTRLAWTGVTEEDFELVTTYENSHYSKPGLKFYTEVLEKLGVEPHETLMVGNDTLDDMIAEELGIDVFLITDYLVNRQNKDISAYKKGSFKDLINYLENLK